MTDVGEQFRGFPGLDQGQEFEEQGQVVGQFARVDLVAVRGVMGGEVDHRLAAVARLAVDMLKQMERQAARPVEQADIMLLLRQEIVGRQPRDERLDRRMPRRLRQPRLLRRNLCDVAECGPQILARVVQQRAQGLEGLHRQASTFRERPPAVGPTRTSWLNRSTLLPPVQPSPKLKPHSPRRSNASSANSRWVVGMTNRSS